jgi:hypothetical protein
MTHYRPLYVMLRDTDNANLKAIQSELELNVTDAVRHALLKLAMSLSEDSKPECEYCKDGPPYQLRGAILVDNLGNRICPDCSKPLKEETEDGE